ncbi:MAG: PD40 domain-containing protein [Candidatus Iainarchaeum archaeon]|uniref:PD40 domain-containing protein n=1 Tax=Candidatus Iainarchaeum sp. TaxID=3101447 RepID=A0A7T9I1V8_9ARCH|nr:MAG: PD40 domain-containing protein [Candidatus Diapherotrites archaeon]
MKWWQWSIGGIAAIVIVVVLINVLAPPVPAPTESEWDAIKAADPAIFVPGWSSPVKVAASNGEWEDSLFVTPDGQRLYFANYPGDLLKDVGQRKFSDDIDIYYSDYPFTTKVKDTRFHLSEDIWSEVGPFVAANGDFFYNSNRDYLNDRKSDQDVWLNDERLAFNDSVPDSEFGNPHYDESHDELWVDELDKKMFILKNAKANDFSGTPELAPAPIQVDGYSNFQPWLSPDGNTLVFSTNRGEIPGLYGPQLYTSTRNPDNTWTTPTLIGYSNIGLGEGTMTADGSRLYYLHLYSDGKGNYTTDMFYVEKV